MPLRMAAHCKSGPPRPKVGAKRGLYFQIAGLQIESFYVSHLLRNVSIVCVRDAHGIMRRVAQENRYGQLTVQKITIFISPHCGTGQLSKQLNVGNWCIGRLWEINAALKARSIHNCMVKMQSIGREQRRFAFYWQAFAGKRIGLAKTLHPRLKNPPPNRPGERPDGHQILNGKVKFLQQHQGEHG